MPKFLETKLKKEYGENSAVPFKVMNSIGAMRGNKETEKGREMEAQHEKDTAMKKATAEPMREMRIEIHRGPAPKRNVTGFTVHHHMMPKASGKSSAFYEDTSHSVPFGADQHEKMMDHVEEHLGAQMGGGEAKAAAEAPEKEGDAEGE
jgi:hypothetical protein